MSEENESLKKEIEFLNEKFKANEQILVKAFKTLREKEGHLKATNTDLENTIVQLKETQARLLDSEKLATLGELSAGMAHQLNTPLASIVASSKNINDFLSSDMKIFINFISQLNDEDRHRFDALFTESMKDTLPLNSAALRAKKKEFLLNFKGSKHNIEGMINEIMESGAYRLGDRILGLLDSEKAKVILENVLFFVNIARSNYIINLAGDMASNVVKALTHYLQAGREKLQGSFGSIQLQLEIENILVLYHAKIKYGIEVIKNFEPNVIGIGDAQMLNQVFINLLNNALQAMEYKGILEIEIKKMDSFAVVSFIDSGKGIPLEIQDKIFNPFFTTKKHGEGFGLGLDICNRLVNNMGGHIKFESEPGRTKFSLFLNSI